MNKNDFNLEDKMVHKKIIQFYKQLKGNQPHTHLCGLCAKLADHNQNIAN